jgi:hypothetical protein
VSDGTIPSAIMRLQRLAGNRAVSGLLGAAGAQKGHFSSVPVQRVKDGFDVKLEKASLELADGFREKHVASDAAEAKAVTHARFEAGKMRYGALPAHRTSRAEARRRIPQAGPRASARPARSA